MSQLHPKIYVACLAAYNNGILYGEWIDANQRAEDLEREIKKMLAKSPIPNAEEWAIHKQDEFAGICLYKHKNLKEISKFAAFVVKHGRLGVELTNYLSEDGLCVFAFKKAKKMMKKAYCGAYENKTAFALQYFSETIRLYFEKILKEHFSEALDKFNYILSYIDHERYRKNLFFNHFFALKVEGKTHIFAKRKNR